jgi:hypothetical protein
MLRRSEIFVRPQVAPLPHRQVAQLVLANPDPLQAHHLQPDHVAHAADLALLAFPERETELVLVLPAYAGRQQRLAVLLQPKHSVFKSDFDRVPVG